MASGKPDWNRIVTIQGKDGLNWRPVKVDGTGQMYIALTGQEIDVNQLDADRNMLGDFVGAKKYVAVDTNGVILARLKGLFAPATLKDVAVDTNGNLICLIKGISGVTETTLHVDGDGKIIAKIQGLSGGDFLLAVVDDCGDTNPVTNWDQHNDGLEPVTTDTYVKQGIYAMKMGVDADLSGEPYARWRRDDTYGDWTEYRNNKLRVWLYIDTIEFLPATSSALRFSVESSNADDIYFNFLKTDFTVGWNLLEMDLSDPTGTTGAIDWTAINRLDIYLFHTNGAADDFFIVLDSIVLIRDYEDTPALQDLQTDANGFLLTKMVGSFGDYLKPLACDKYGNLRVNPTQTDKKPLLIGRTIGNLLYQNIEHNHAGVSTYTMINLVGPGMINAMHLYHRAGANHENCKCVVTVDGTEHTDFSYRILDLVGITHPDSNIPFLLLNDTTNFRHVVSIKAGLHFHTQFKIVSDETTGASDSYLRISYTLL